MIKGILAYTTPAITMGVEAFVNHGKNDVVASNGIQKDTLNAIAQGVSVFVKGQVIKDKLGFFARFDSFNPDKNYNQFYNTYSGFTSAYAPNNKEIFITTGLDFVPAKNIHFLPSIWYNRYTSQQTNLTGSALHDYDLVYRITFFYTYGR